MQAGLPLLTGVLRDRGVEPRWLVGLASWQISLCAFLITRIRGEPPRYRCHLGCILLRMAAISLLTGPLGAVLYGLNFGSVWGVKMTTTAMTCERKRSLI